MLPTKFRFIWSNGFRGEESKKSANQKQESSVVALYQVRVITVFTVFRLLTDFVCLYNYEF
jgi:hypothetical protein